MDWRSAHRWIAITNGAEIKLSDNTWGNDGLHMRDVRVARRKNRVKPGSRLPIIRTMARIVSQHNVSPADEARSSPWVGGGGPLRPGSAF